MFELKKELLETHEAILTLDIDDETERRAIQKTTRRISREVNIPGFRKGKAPPNIVMRMIGRDTVLAEAAEDLLQDFYPKALEQAEIEPYGPAEIEDINLSPMRVSLRVPLMPVVELGDYEGVRLEPEPVQITEEEMASALDNIRDEHAILEPIEGPAEEGDVLLLSLFEGEHNGDVLVHEHDLEVVLDPEREFVVSGVMEQLVGLSAGDEETFSVTLPEDFEDEALRGEELQFTLEVDQAYERTLPELDDALASTVGNYETLEELKDDLRAEMLEYKERQAEKKYRDALLDAYIAQASIHYPPLMIEQEIDDKLEEMKADIKRRSDMAWDDILAQQGIDEEQVREDLRPSAVESIEIGLILAEFADLFDVEVSDEKVKAEMTSSLQQMGISDPNLLGAFKSDSPAGRDTHARLMARKTLERLERLAQGLPIEEPEAVEESEEEELPAPSESEIETEPESEPQADIEDDTVGEEEEHSDADDA